ncbi:hypothetical protein [Xanthovirga aplysinae]|uniref:hypothetical protein n=1 Tax=Xanthovirga aplysinae TaxID=2529853 RepID=UPI0012BB8B35|nr:hypothetical protein [Xanthovirga aplysinae]MTI30591.1 hypothetical protein [Xanthovirga aplysinae]
MTQTFTQDDVVKYLYKETTSEESEEIERALLFDTELLEVYHQMRAVVHQLDNLNFEPSERCSQKILDYSKSFNLFSF